MEDEMVSFDDIMNNVQEMAHQLIKTAKVTDAISCGLDERCGTLYIGVDFVATRNRSRLDYYGGFEYIEKEHIQEIGDYTFYSINADRANDAWEAYVERAELAN